MAHGLEIAKELTGEALLANGNYEPVTLGKSPSEEFANELNQNVFGQAKAARTVARAVINAQAGFADPRKPKASFLFLGPTGVGKTEMARTMAEALRLPFIRIDCTELQEISSVTRLKGTEPKFVGYGDPTLIMPEMIKDGAVVVFDEIEKAHPEIWKWLMPVMDEGKTTLFLPTGKPNPNGSAGQQVAPTELSFTKTYIVLTSNEGAEAIQETRRGDKKRVGFTTSKDCFRDPNADLESNVLKALRSNRFKSYPEFLARIRHTIVFSDLTAEHYSQIFDKFIGKSMQDLATNNSAEAFMLAVTTPLKEAVLREAKTAQYGARDLARAIETMIIAEASDYKAAGSFKPGDSIVADYDQGGIKFYRLVQEVNQVNKINVPEIPKTQKSTLSVTYPSSIVIAHS